MSFLSQSATSRLVRVCFCVPVVLWMAVIFFFSAQNADDSSEISGKTIEMIAQKVVPDFNEKTEVQQEKAIRNLQHSVRKTAHFFEYLILGILMCVAFLPKRSKRLYRFFIPLILCVLYALTDEVHQIFVPGRGPGVFDVLLDSCGALFGILLFLFVAPSVGAAKKRG